VFRIIPLRPTEKENIGITYQAGILLSVSYIEIIQAPKSPHLHG
jgi:hypothetical protein